MGKVKNKRRSEGVSLGFVQLRGYYHDMWESGLIWRRSPEDDDSEEKADPKRKDLLDLRAFG